MSSRIDSGQPLASISTSPTFQEAIGHLHGQSVRPQSSESAVAMSHKLLNRQIRNKSISRHQLEETSLQRLIVQDKKRGQGATDSAAARIVDFYEKLPGMPDRAKLDALISQFIAYQERIRLWAKDRPGAGAADEDEDEEEDEIAETAGESRRTEIRYAIEGMLQQFDGDASHQFAAFETLKALLEEEDVDKDFEAAISQIDRHFQDVAHEILNRVRERAIEAEAAATLATDPAAARNGYLRILASESSFAALFDSMLRYDPLKRADKIIETFTLLVGADLSSLTGPEADRDVIAPILLCLSKLKKLRTVLDGSRELMRQVAPKLQDEPSEDDSINLTSRILRFIEKSNPTRRDVLALIPQAA